MAGSTSDNHVHNIAIIGAGGQCGKYVTEALLKNGKHHVTAITRPESTNTIPSGATVKRVSYDDTTGLTEALKGQDVLIIFMKAGSTPDAQIKLIDAAAAAGVPWILPNEWGSVDAKDESVKKDTLIGAQAEQVRKHIESKRRELMVRHLVRILKKEVTFFDDGNTKIIHSTWPQVGRAVANLLSLPIKSEGGGPSLEQFKNDHVYIASYTASQKDIFESVLHVTGTKEKDWKISHEDVKERYKKGFEMMKSGNMMGFGQLLYARMFYPDGSGDLGSRYGLHNDVLGLPKEDFDESTKLAIQMDAEDYHGFRKTGGLGARYEERKEDGTTHVQYSTDLNKN